MTVIAVSDTVVDLVDVLVVMIMTMHVLTVVDRVMIRWLHLEDKISLVSEGICRVENAAILLKGATQFATPTSTSPEISQTDTHRLQSTVGSLLYYARALDCTMLPTLNQIG